MIVVHTVYPKKYAHGFVVLCFVVVMQSFITNSHEVFIHINQGCFAGTEAIVRLPQCQCSKPDGYGKFSQCITTTKHSKAKTVCIFLGIYCMVYAEIQAHVFIIDIFIYKFIVHVNTLDLNLKWKRIVPLLQGPVSPSLMTSQLKAIITHTKKKQKTVKCKFFDVWGQNFVWNFKGVFWNFTQNFEPIHRKISILGGVRHLTTHDILELWHLKS